MAHASFILFPGPATWRIARWRRGQCERFDVAAADVAAQLAELGHAGGPVALAVASDACLAARIATTGLPRGDAKAMLYQFEEKLPVAAEQVVADFVSFERPTSSGDGALGVCALLDRVRPSVAAMEDAGVPVQAIVPAMLAAAQEIGAAHAADPTPVVLLLGDFTAPTPTVSAVAVRAGRPVDWAVLPATVADVRLHLAFLSGEFDAAPRIVAAGLSAELVGGLTDALSQVVTVSDASPFDAAAEAGAAALAGRGRPWADLRRGPLAVTDSLRQHRRALNAALAAVAAALVVTAASLLARSVRYDRLAAAADARARSEFRDHFPGWVMPTNVRAVLEGEHRRAAAGVSGGAAPTSAGSYGSALATLRDVLAGLPATGTMTVERMSVGDEAFELSGRVAAYDQMDAIVAGVTAAARRAGMAVPTPQTRREAGGTWTFLIQGSRSTPPPTADAR